MTGLYLYGIVAAPGPRHLVIQGLDQQPVQVKVTGSFAVLYSEAQQERYLASRAHLLAHEKVLEKVMSEGYRSLLPLQFGLVVADWEQIQTDLINRYGSRLQDLLTHLEGKREVGIKVFWDPEKELQLGLQENPELQAKRDAMVGAPLGFDAVVRIGQELEHLLENRRRTIADTFRLGLQPLSHALVEGDLLTENMAYNASFLINWDDEPIIAHRVDELDQQFQGRLRIRYNNFTAPYNFTKL